MTDHSNISIPTIHLNGSHGPTLLKEYETAVHALNTALEAMSEAAPNGRDYYPQGDSAINTATRQHEARVDAIRKVRDELAHIYDQVENVLDERTRNGQK